MDEQAYLEPGFDPATFTVPQLRSVLLAHQVNYPSSAKKKELIDLFKDNVVPQARKLRTANARVKRTSRGIVDVPASQQSADYDDEEEEQAPPPRSTSRKSAGRTTRARTEEAQEVVPPTKQSRHSTAPPEGTPKRLPSKHARTIEEEQEPEPKRPASRKSRPSAATPLIKSEHEDSSNFSNDNVFQAGSSPPTAPTDRRRTTMSTTKDADRRRSRETRRRTEEVKPARAQMDGAVVPTRRTFDMPVSAVKREDVQPGEEFTEEEEQALVQAQQAGELVPTRRRPRRPASTTVKTSAGAIALAMFAGVAGLWGQEKFQVGYCEVGQPSTEVAGVEIPRWADVVRPQCEPCPPHAICHDKLETRCEPGFVLSHHPLSLNGILPFPPTCDPDTEKTRKVNIAKEQVVEALRTQNAKYECGDAKSPEIQEDQLKTAFQKKKAIKMTNEEFEDLWNSAIGEVRETEEITTGTDGSGHFTIRSNSHAKFPLSCQVRRHLRETLRQYLWQLIGIILFASSVPYTRYRIISGRKTEQRVRELTGFALEELSQQAALHASDPNRYPENSVPVAQLRDDVLRNEFSTTARKKLWEAVQQKVEHNSNVRPMVREGRSGDVGRAWEWIGATRMIESSPTGNERRKSGRVSFGGEQWIEPRSEYSTEMSQLSKWEEGRPYY